jgi:hypothetical protein
MSVVTDVLVTYHYERGHPPKAMNQVNGWLAEHNGSSLVELNFSKIPHGGSKIFQTELWCGALNYLDVAEFLSAFAWAEWAYPDLAQVIYRHEHGLPKLTVATAAELRLQYPKGEN